MSSGEFFPLNSLASAPDSDFSGECNIFYGASHYLYFSQHSAVTHRGSCQKGTPPGKVSPFTLPYGGASRCAFWFYDFIIHLWSLGPKQRAILILLFFITPSLYLIAHFLRDVVVGGNPFGFRTVKVPSREADEDEEASPDNDLI